MVVYVVKMLSANGPISLKMSVLYLCVDMLRGIVQNCSSMRMSFS